ncbi:tRNA(His) guanylyltransferase Thg1 family protein [Nonomuraea sp. NPDC026600]|uniref:tRNA(His) guanylyltransferase Thg1 family protein n=1 Tax=Nonomuraea sp. NPDC026600 TaxID=3155363 RepID=UPI0033DBBA0B
MSDTTALGDRMKAYEQVTRTMLPRRTYTIVRVDGRAFHTFLRHADRPFDDAVVAAMDAVGQTLCKQMAGAVLAYTQSDECSVLITDFATPRTQPWFGGVVQKIASVAASIAAVAFNEQYGLDYDDAIATFDGRVFTIPDVEEVAAYFQWRQRDCVRNSITMAAQAKFSHQQLHGKRTGDMQEMLWSQHGINWNDYPAGVKRGRVCVRRAEPADITYTDQRTQRETTKQVTRSRWEIEAAPSFTADPTGWLAAAIPARARTPAA